MGSSLLVIVRGSASGLDRRDAAAIAMARRLASGFADAVDVLVTGVPLALPGTWRNAWLLPDEEPRAIAVEAASIVDTGNYTAVMLGETVNGREIAGRLAARLGVPVIASVQSARLSAGRLELTRPAVAGTRSVTLSPIVLPAIILASADTAPSDAGSLGTPVMQQLSVSSLFEPPPLLGETRLSPWEMDVTEAEVVVAGGRGVGGPDGFDMLATLAQRLGGAIGATRVAVDLGWVPRDRQVGLTGRTVSPRLYLACGISGAIHHTLGMRDSGFVVAINTDARCPMFAMANASIVGDVREVVPALVAEIDARREADLRPEPAGAVR